MAARAGAARQVAGQAARLVCDRLGPGEKWVVAVPNTAGAGSLRKELSNAIGSPVSLHKHNCRDFHTAEDGPENEVIQ